VHEANKARARNAVTLAGFAIKTLQDHVASQIAKFEAADADA